MNPENNMGNGFGGDNLNSSSLGVMPNNTNLEGNTLNQNPSLNMQPNNNDLNQGVAAAQTLGSFNSQNLNTTLNDALNNTLNQASINNVEPTIQPQQAIEPAPVYNEQVVQSPVQPVATENLYQPTQAPSIEPLPNLDNQVSNVGINTAVENLGTPNPNLGVGSVNSNPMPNLNEQPVQEVTTPTMPIPDSMPDLTYQAGVSTPVDYATPMSDFDEIGVTPELDPKDKGNKNKKGGKTLTFILIILAIASLGAGAYYFINVKGILNKSSVTTNNLVVEMGSTLSEDINDYATFKNMSSTNCVQDTSKVNVNEAGTYEYVIKCGTDEYKGTIEVKDTTAPSVTLYAKIIKTGITDGITADSFVKSCSETNCTYAFETEDALTNASANKGINSFKLNVSDESGNKNTIYVPIIVLDENLHVGLIASKELDTASEEYKIVEKIVIIYSDLSTFSYTMYDFKFDDETTYKSFVSNNPIAETLTVGDYSGIPVFNDTEKKLTLVSNKTSDVVQGSYPIDRQSFINLGYNVDLFASDQLSKMDF